MWIYLAVAIISIHKIPIDEDEKCYWTGLLKTKLNAYIVKNYTELCRDDDQYLMWDAGESLAKDAGLTNNESLDLKSLIDEVGDTFHDKLFQYIDNSGMADVEI